MADISKDDVQQMSVRELKDALARLGSSGAGCIEKSELQERLVELLSRTTDQEQSQSPEDRSNAVRRTEEKGVHGLLDCIILEGGANQNCKGVLTIVLMHGYGANKEDLAPIGDALMTELAKAAKKVNWGVRFLVPDAPFVLQGASRQWWPLDMMRLAMAAMSGQLDAIWNENPDADTNSHSTERVVEFIEKECELVRSLHRAEVEHRIVLSGFSQGAMLAANVALRHATRLAQIHTLCLFSSAMVTKAEWVDLAAELGKRQPPLRVFQSHGKVDAIVPFIAGTQLRELFRSAGVNCEFMEFHGPHTIPQTVVHRFLQLSLEALN